MKALLIILALGLVCGAAGQDKQQKKRETYSEDVGEGLIRVGGLATHGDNEQAFQQYFADKNCREFRFSGWNSWEIVEAAYGQPNALPKDQWTEENGKELVKYIFDAVEDAGIKVCLWAEGWQSCGLGWKNVQFSAHCCGWMEVFVGILP